MPMLTTLRMRLPVWPFQSPLRTRLANAVILSSTACTSGTTLRPSTTIDAPRGARSATCSTARFSVTLILSPRNIASMRARSPDSSASCSSRRERLVGDAVLRVVEEDAGGLGRQPLAARGVVGEELAQRRGRGRRPGARPAPSMRPASVGGADRRSAMVIVLSAFLARASRELAWRAARGLRRGAASSPTAETRRGRRWRCRRAGSAAAAP